MHLRHLPELRVLNLANCTALTDEGLACLGQLQGVQTLNLQVGQGEGTWGMQALPVSTERVAVSGIDTSPWVPFKSRAWAA